MNAPTHVSEPLDPHAVPPTLPPEPPPNAPSNAEENEPAYGVDSAFVAQVEALLRAGRVGAVRAEVEDLHAADIADLIEQIDPALREDMVEVLRPGFDAEVLSYLNPGLRDAVVEVFEPKELAAAVAELDTDDAADVIGGMDDETRAAVLENLPAEDRALVQENLAYGEDTAGRLMQRDLVAVPQFWTVGQTIGHLRATADDGPEDFHAVFVVDPLHRVMGTLPLARLLRHTPDTPVSGLIDDDFHTIPATMDQEEVANLFRQYALVSAPVVDAAERLIGVVTVDDVVHVIDEEAGDDLLKMGGVGDAGVYQSVLKTARARVVWLVVNLGTAFLASAVIAQFEATIEKIVALAVLMPIVASMGGNAGTQTVTVAVRALATRQLLPSNAVRLLNKELVVGVINGVVFAVMVGLIAGAWFDAMIGVVIACAMVINLFVAALFGMLIPLGLERLGADPAVASTVFLTTVTDVVGFFSFLGLAAAILL